MRFRNSSSCLKSFYSFLLPQLFVVSFYLFIIFLHIYNQIQMYSVFKKGSTLFFFFQFFPQSCLGVLINTYFFNVLILAFQDIMELQKKIKFIADIFCHVCLQQFWILEENIRRHTSCQFRIRKLVFLLLRVVQCYLSGSFHWWTNS